VHPKPVEKESLLTAKSVASNRSKSLKKQSSSVQRSLNKEEEKVTSSCQSSPIKIGNQLKRIIFQKKKTYDSD